MIGRFVSSHRVPCLGLALGAVLGFAYGGDRLGFAAEVDEATSGERALSARQSAGLDSHEESSNSVAVAPVSAPSEDWGVPELLARDLAMQDVEGPAGLGLDEISLPHTPLQPDQAADLLDKAWRDVTGSRLPDDGLAVVWSHWALETGRGERMVGFNFGGLKGQSPEGGSVRLWTRERRDDELTLVRRRFRAYPDAAAGARDYVQLLQDRYPRARRAVERGSVIDFVQGLTERGYFTDDPERYLRAMRSLSREFLTERAARSPKTIAEGDGLTRGREI